jgi:hypothetical protein
MFDIQTIEVAIQTGLTTTRAERSPGRNLGQTAGNLGKSWVGKLWKTKDVWQLFFCFH